MSRSLKFLLINAFALALGFNQLSAHGGEGGHGDWHSGGEWHGGSWHGNNGNNFYYAHGPHNNYYYGSWHGGPHNYYYGGWHGGWYGGPAYYGYYGYPVAAYPLAYDPYYYPNSPVVATDPYPAY